jgi:D-glycerate 3-kinase
MKIDTILFIQKELKDLTNKNFSKKYISQFIIPIINNINNSKDNKFIIAGPQGSGKSTLTKLLKLTLEKIYKKKVMLLSIDDYYLSKKKRIELSKKVHSLLITRGVPGTHNIKKLKDHINQFIEGKYPINTLTFDKLTDDVSKKRRIIKNADILLFEGWCCGSKPMTSEYLYKNINNLERKLDKNNKWRKYYNTFLKKEYFEIFSKFDKKIYIKPPSFMHVLKWRHSQEKQNALINKKKKFMSKPELKYFIEHYEKLTRWMIKTMPAKASIIININKNQKIEKVFTTDNYR